MQFTSWERKIGEIAKTYHYSIALPESKDARILAAAQYLLKTACAQKLYLFLSRKDFIQSCKGAGFSHQQLQEKVVFLPEEVPDIAKKTYDHIIEHRQKQSKTICKKDTLTNSENPLYQAGYLTAIGASQLSLAGAVATTAAVIKAALATIPLNEEVSRLSSSFFLVREEKSREQVLLFADCAVLVEPTSAELADIALASCDTWQQVMGQEEPPKIAFLSFASKGSAEHARIDHVRHACSLVRARRSELLCDGELQFDAAYDADVAMLKCPSSPLAGQANIFIFPNLEAGNIAYKIAQKLGGFSAYGPILQGLAKPYSDLSRGCTVKDVVVTSYLNILRAAHTGSTMAH